MLDDDRVEDFLVSLADRFTATELVEMLELTEWDIIEMFRDKILESDKKVFEV